MMSRMIALLMLCFCSTTFAQDNVTLTYQGQLSNAVDEPVTASYSVKFSLYTQRSGGESLWTETHDSVDVVDGVFSVDLGTITPLETELSEQVLLYLGITVGESDEMSPRVRVGGALKAQWAKIAEHARDVRGENIHPASVSIGDSTVIDNQGRWVGDTAGLIGPQGEVGPGGPQGLEGPQGVQGAVGPTGEPGIQGTQGPPGTDGVSVIGSRIEDGTLIFTLTGGTEVNVGNVIGADGAQGPQGPRGEVGPVGPQGPAGVNGSQGPAGSNGSQGVQGPIGQQGPAGPQGAQGPQGQTGLTGPAGLDAVADFSAQTKYVNFNGGFQMRWGTAVNDIDGIQTVAFGAPFTTACESVVITRMSGNSKSAFAVTGCNVANFTIDRNDDVQGSQRVQYMAVGY